MRFRNKSDDSEAEINLTPLIDVVFLLLIFFMVTTTFSREAQIKLKLPEATSSEQVSPEENSLTIQISDIGQFAVQGPGEEVPRELINTSEATLQRAIKSAAGDMRDPMIIIRADRLATHESVVQAMNAARNLGFFQVTFSTGRPN
jgi:biopolymer transport protein ExbD